MATIQYPATHDELAAAGYQFRNNKPCTGPTCNTLIYWYLTPNKRAMPMAFVADRDGKATFQPHFADCNDRKRF